MLKRKNLTETNFPEGLANAALEKQALFQAPQAGSEGVLERLMDGFATVQIEDPISPFNVDTLVNVAKHVDYGVLRALEGTWVSYASKADQSQGKLIGTGVHTTIMPSPGTNAGGIPGKYSFECEEYVEKLVFNLVPGGVRNRGGANEQFCGAIKYEQSIKSVNKVDGDPNLLYTGIHEENGMYLWLSYIFNHAATAKSIEEDRGIHPLEPGAPNKDLYKSGYQDETVFRISPDGSKPEYVTLENLHGRPYYDITPAKELQPGAGQTGTYFIPDYAISRSGVIPHGSTITLLGNLVPDSDSNFLIQGPPQFPHGDAAWKFDHLSLSPTMGGAGTTEADPINLDQPQPAWVFEKLDKYNDPQENLIYTQRILAHPLYPYSVRPDLRLRDSITRQDSTKEQETIKNHVHIRMSSKNKTGAQGGILNVPFVNRFVPTVEMNTNMWVETVVEDGREILQLQYEQVILFEFHFGDNGGTTSWPHIQVNTLRKIEDVSDEQRRLMEEQFPAAYTIGASAPASGCPYPKA